MTEQILTLVLGVGGAILAAVAILFLITEVHEAFKYRKYYEEKSKEWADKYYELRNKVK